MREGDSSGDQCGQGSGQALGTGSLIRVPSVGAATPACAQSPRERGPRRQRDCPRRSAHVGHHLRLLLMAMTLRLPLAISACSRKALRRCRDCRVQSSCLPRNSPRSERYQAAAGGLSLDHGRKTSGCLSLPISGGNGQRVGRATLPSVPQTHIPSALTRSRMPSNTTHCFSLGSLAGICIAIFRTPASLGVRRSFLRST